MCSRKLNILNHCDVNMELPLFFLKHQRLGISRIKHLLKQLVCKMASKDMTSKVHVHLISLEGRFPHMFLPHHCPCVLQNHSRELLIQLRQFEIRISSFINEGSSRWMLITQDKVDLFLKKSIRQSNLNVLLTLFQISSRFDFSRCIVFILHLDIYFISSVQ